LHVGGAILYLTLQCTVRTAT